MVTLTPFHSVLDRMITISRAIDAEGETHGATAIAPAWFPAVDMYETASDILVTLDVPGVAAADLDISFAKNTLTIKGSRSPLVRPADGEFRLYASERASGEFTRSVRLPQFVDAEKIEAKFVDGVLTVRIPKAAGALPRKIAVNG